MYSTDQTSNTVHDIARRHSDMTDIMTDVLNSFNMLHCTDCYTLQCQSVRLID